MTESARRPFARRARASSCIAAAVHTALAVLAGSPGLANAQTPPAPAREPTVLQGDPVVVTATRSAERAFSVPASIDAVEAPEIRDGKPRVNISEDLGQVPGVVANNRYNYAQDLQISSRGFGARSTFGVRGVRLMQDGIPLTMPDGQGQSGLFELDSAARIEVLRGPFAALYGNSSGGVIQLFTQAPPQTPEVDVFGAAGSYGTWRAAGRVAGTYEGIGGAFGYSQFRTDGYRDWSWARRDITSGRVQMNLGPDATLTVLGFYVGQPDTQDPGGLTQQQVDQNRRQAGTDTVRFGTRKSINHGQGGAIYELRITPKDTVSLMGYVGDRQVTQFLAFQGAGIGGSGGVVDLDRSFGGAWLTWRHATELAGGPFNFTAAVNYDSMLERRKGFVNNFGVTGALRRNEQDRVYDFAQYVQAEWQFAPRWKASGGVRHTDVTFRVTDYFVVPGNPNDSGTTDYSAWLPVAGILYELTPAVNLYASAGKGFETPTFAELAYRPDGLPGVNFALQPARSNMYEAGVKSLVGGFARVNAAAFYAVTDQDIVSAGQIAGGRNVFTNAQQTTRGGFELSGDAQFGAGFSGQLAYTYLDARFSDYVQAHPRRPAEPPLRGPAVAAGADGILSRRRGTLRGEGVCERREYGFRAELRDHQPGRRLDRDVRAPARRSVRAPRQRDRQGIHRLGHRECGERSLLRAIADAERSRGCEPAVQLLGFRIQDSGVGIRDPGCGSRSLLRELEHHRDQHRELAVAQRVGRRRQRPEAPHHRERLVIEHLVAARLMDGRVGEPSTGRNAKPERRRSLPAPHEREARVIAVACECLGDAAPIAGERLVRRRLRLDELCDRRRRWGRHGEIGWRRSVRFRRDRGVARWRLDARGRRHGRGSCGDARLWRLPRPGQRLGWRRLRRGDLLDGRRLQSGWRGPCHDRDLDRVLGAIDLHRGQMGPVPRRPVRR